MTIESLLQSASNASEFAKIVKESRQTKSEDIKKHLEQFEVSGHAVNDASKRPDKNVTNEAGEVTKVVRVNRLPVSYQKTIVNRAATFLCGNPVELNCSPKDEAEKKLLSALRLVWESNKLDYTTKRLAKHMMSETECAELWYPEAINGEDNYWEGTLSDKAKFRLRMRVLAPSLKDELYPVFSDLGDMIAFGRGYTLKVGDKTVEHIDVYTNDNIYKLQKEDTDWTLTPITNQFKKIPVIYYNQPQVEWNDVQGLIERLETLISNHADTNDYFGSPAVMVEGQVTGFSEKGETGKVFQVDKGGSMRYITWDSSPESVRMEYENLDKLIHALSDTPNISFEQIKTIGGLSGVALKMFFMAAHMKAADKEGIFGECIQRRLNFILTAIKTIDVSTEKVPLKVKPVFHYFLPEDVMGQIEALTSAVNGKIMSRQSAVRLNPLVEDAESELKLLEQQKGDELNDEFEDV